MRCKLADITIDGKGSYGIAASSIPRDNSKYTYLRITDINDDGTLNYQGLQSVDDENSNKFILFENDIVFARTGASTGRSYFYDKNDGTLVFAGFLIKFSINPNKVNPKILKYYTHSKKYYDWVNSFSNGATRGNINAKTFSDMEIELPERYKQDKIVSILSSLDDKIAVNRKICENLETQAQALFKNWFVDFEPFKNGEFVESELGMIPKGWKAGTLGDISNQTSERIIGDGNYNVFSAVATGELVLSEEYFTKQVFSKSLNGYKIVHDGEFAYNPARVNIGSIGQNKYGYDGCVSPIYIVLHFKKEYISFFDMLRKTKRFKKEVMSKAIGGVRQSLNYYDFSIINVVIPPVDVVERFNALMNEINICKETRLNESSRLAALRDTLLPKLMSGEIEVGESM